MGFVVFSALPFGHDLVTKSAEKIRAATLVVFLD